jgi:hypothetical protein
LGAIVGGLIAFIGFPAIATGVLLSFVALSIAMYRTALGIGINSIALSPDGLRLFVRGGATLVPWTNIVSVERAGADPLNMLLFVRLNDVDAIFSNLTPDTEANRTRLRSTAIDADSRLMLNGWIGGVDSGVMLRTLESATKGETPSTN